MKKVSREFANDVITTAVEGGIGYWALISDYRIDDPDTTAKIRPDDDAGFEDREWPVLLDRDMVQKGLDLLTNTKIKVNPIILGAIIWGVNHEDAGDIDADCADVIVQVAVFGEVVFG